MAQRFYTINGCYYTTPSVNPKNWKSGGSKLIQKDWQIQYYFFDPEYADTKPYGKAVAVRGMNHCKDLHKRREITQLIINDEIDAMNQGYNHFTSLYMVDESIKYGILHPELTFITAFRIAHSKIKASPRYLESVSYGIDHIEQAAIKLKMTKILISKLKRRELKLMLDTCNLTDDGYNRHKCYLSTLFNELVEYECCDHNLTRDIRRKQIEKKVRRIYTSDELKMVFSHLKKTDYHLYRFAYIFMLSGSRITELLRIKKNDIDIDNQEYTIIIKKGSLNTEVKKVILKESMNLWMELMAEAGPDDFIFSDQLAPGPKHKKRAYITQKWKRQVKDALNLEPDLYSLKHSLLDSLPLDLASKMASHTSSNTTAIYRVNQEKRDREVLKNLQIKFN